MLTKDEVMRSMRRQNVQLERLNQKKVSRICFFIVENHSKKYLADNYEVVEL